MANKREFKKFVSAVGSGICEDMLFNALANKEADRAKTQEAVQKVLAAVVKAQNNANVFFDKGVKAFGSHAEYSKAKRAYFKALFKKINADFAHDLEGAVAEFNKAMPKAK